MTRPLPVAPKGMTVQKSGMGYVVLFKLNGVVRITSRHQFASDAIAEAQKRIAQKVKT